MVEEGNAMIWGLYWGLGIVDDGMGKVHSIVELSVTVAIYGGIY